jgi:hypothetical protein
MGCAECREKGEVWWSGEVYADASSDIEDAFHTPRSCDDKAQFFLDLPNGQKGLRDIRPVVPVTDSLNALEVAFPDEPLGELKRFARARPFSPEQALEMYEGHMAWRGEQGKPCNLAAASDLVRGFWLHGGDEIQVARDGTRVLFMQAARIDMGEATLECYMCAVCFTLDKLLREGNQEPLTVLLDTRPGVGWPNPPARKLLPLILQAAEILPKHYPESLRRLIVYPVPAFAIAFVRMLKGLLDPTTLEKLVLLPGSDRVGAACPVELNEYICKASLPEHVWDTHIGL